MKNSIMGLGLLGMIFLIGCGSGNNVARGTINGQLIELGVDSVYCDAGFPSIGGDIGGAIGSSPLSCVVYYETGRFNDRLEIFVADAEVVYYDYLDTWRPFDGTLIRGNITIQGIPQPILDSYIKFKSISNASGYPVCAEYDIITALGQIEGKFCTKVRNGY